MAEETLTSSSNILEQLNDDCLLQIFEWLPLRDLCRVSNVCLRFEWNAVSVFERKFSNTDLNELIDDNDTDSKFDWSNHESLLPMESVGMLFRCFGAHIRTLHLDAEDFDDNQKDQILELMINYCADDDGKLDKLVVHGVEIGADVMLRLEPLFNRLKSLDVTDGSYYVGVELTELTLEDVDLHHSFTRSLPNLHKMSLINVSKSFDGAFGTFVESNRHLKSLTIWDSIGHFCNLIDLLHRLSELEELKLDMNVRMMHEVNDLALLQHLKVFSFNCMWAELADLLNSFVEQNVALEELNLRYLKLDHNIAASLAQLSKIRKLCFDDGQVQNGQLPIAVKGMPHLEKLYLTGIENVNMDDIKGVIENAPKLKELQMDRKRYYNELDEEVFIIQRNDFNEICQFIARRVNRIKLNLNISGDRCKLNVPENIIMANACWLEVQIITYKNAELIDVIEYYDPEDEDGSNDSGEDGSNDSGEDGSDDSGEDGSDDSREDGRNVGDENSESSDRSCFCSECDSDNRAEDGDWSLSSI